MKKQHLFPAGLFVLCICQQITDPLLCLMFGFTSIFVIHTLIKTNDAK